MQKPSSPFLASIFEFMVVRHYAKSTIEAYIYWIRWQGKITKALAPQGLAPDSLD